MLRSHFVGLFLLSLPRADKDDTVESRKYRPLVAATRANHAAFAKLLQDREDLRAQTAPATAPAAFGYQKAMDFQVRRTHAEKRRVTLRRYTGGAISRAELEERYELEEQR